MEELEAYANAKPENIRDVTLAWGKALLAASHMCADDPEHLAEIVADFEERFGPSPYLQAMLLPAPTAIDAIKAYHTENGELLSAMVSQQQAATMFGAINGILDKFNKSLTRRDARDVRDYVEALALGPLPEETSERLQKIYVKRMKSEDPEVVLSEMLEDRIASSLQLFGMPGTGKTAAVKFAIRALGPQNVSAVFINGYVVRGNADLYQAVYEHLAKERLDGRAAAQHVPAEQCGAALDKRFRGGWGTTSRNSNGRRDGGRANIPLSHNNKKVFQPRLTVIVIDEMDKCLEKCAKAVLKIVDWLTMPSARCKLISIANSMELTLDSKTRSRLDATRKVVFPPYVVGGLQ